MRTALWEGLFFNGFFVTTHGFILITLAIYFQASPFLISMLSVMPVIAQVFQVICPLYQKCCRSQRKALTFAAIGARFPFILLPFAVLVGLNEPWLLFVVILLFSLMSAFINNIWTTGMRMLIPQRKRGRYFGMRSLFVTSSGMFFTLFYSYLLDLPWKGVGIFLVTLLASFFALVTIRLLSHHRFPKKKEPLHHLDLRTPLTHRNFRSFLTFCAVWVFALELTRPFFFYFALEYMHVPNSFLGQMTVITGLFSIVLYVIYGKVADRFGNKPLLYIGIHLSVLSPALYLIMNPANVHFALFLDHIITAFSFSAVNLAFFNFLLETVDDPAESYLGVYAIILGAVALVAGVIAGLLAQWLRPFSIEVFGQTFYGIQFLFLLGLIARLCAGIPLKKVEAVKDPRLRGLMKNFFGIGIFRARETFLGFSTQYLKSFKKTGEKVKKPSTFPSSAQTKQKKK